MKRFIPFILCISFMGLIGCSGLDNPCNDQGAGHCASVTTAYDNSLKNTVNETDLPRGDDGKGGGGWFSSEKKPSLSEAYKMQNTYSQIPKDGVALRTQTKTMRVWILPYEDDVGLYHDQQYVYAVIKNGGWMFKSVNNRITDSQDSYSHNVLVSGNPSIKYKPFVAKESDAIGSNQGLISAVGGNNQISTQAIANKNATTINSIVNPIGSNK